MIDWGKSRPPLSISLMAGHHTKVTVLNMGTPQQEIKIDVECLELLGLNSEVMGRLLSGVKCKQLGHLTAVVKHVEDVYSFLL